MELIMSSPIQNCAEMENDRAAANLREYEESEKRRLLRKLEVARPNVGMIPQSSIQVNPNTDLGATAMVQLSKRQIKRNKKLLREHIENPETKLEVARQIVDMITQPSIPDYSMITESSIQDFSNTELGTSANVQPCKRKRTEKLLREHIENPESTLEVARQNVDVMTQSSIQDNANSDLGTTATVKLSKNQKKRKRKLLRKDTENHESKLEVPCRNVDDIIQSESSIPKREGYMEIDKVEKGSRRTISGDVKSGSEREEHMEIVNDMRGSSRSATVDVKPSSRSEEQLEVGNRAIGAHDAKSTMLKGELNMNIAISETVSSGTVVIDAGSKREEHMRTASGETASGTVATPDAKMVPKGEEHTKVAHGEMGSNMPKNVHVEGTIEKKKRKKSRRKKPTLGENLNSQQLEDMEVATGEMDSGTTATDNTVSKKRKRQKLENKNSASGDILGTPVCTQDTVLAKKGLSSTKILEPTSGQPVSCKTATPDANMSKGKEQTKVANGEIGSSELKKFTVNGIVPKRDEQESKKQRPTLGEILNPQYSQNLEAGNIATSGKSSARKKRKKLNKKAAIGETLTTSENTQDSVIAKKDAGTNKVLEVTSTESKREDTKEILNGEKCLRTTPLDASIGCTEVVNSEMGSSGTITILENEGSRETSTLDMKTVSKREEHTGSSGTTTIDAKTVSKVEEGTRISRKKEKMTKKKGDAGLKAIDVIPHVPTSEKKLLVFDVNGLLADIVSPAPKDARADIYIPRRAIFKRPFLDDFLRFCFERFHIGIWSSRTKKVLDPVVNYLLGGLKNKLLFLWDASSCSNSGMRTLEERHKFIVFKDLRKIWEKNGPRNSWVKGIYNDSNTLLLDDSPYKALLNPKHCGIFPVSYSYKNKNDNFLGPTGVLRTYLEGVAATDNLKMYVEQHPLGQAFIDEKNPHWSFYKRVLKSRSYLSRGDDR